MDTKLKDMSDYERTIESLHRECVESGFSPRPIYHSNIDSLLFFMSDELSYRKRVNSLLTVFLSDETDEVIGVEIKGFKRLCENMRRFKVDNIIQNHPTLGLLLWVAVTTPDDGKEWIDSELAGLDKYTDVNIPQECFEFA